MSNMIEEARKLRKLIEKAAESLPDDYALQGPALFPAWSATNIARSAPMEYKKDFRVRYENQLYKCLQDHTAQTDWTPSASPSLWVRVDDPSVQFPDWVQPAGSTDAYNKGDKVTYNNQHWISIADNNVWIPGEFGWELSTL